MGSMYVALTIVMDTNDKDIADLVLDRILPGESWHTITVFVPDAHKYTDMKVNVLQVKEQERNWNS